MLTSSKPGSYSKVAYCSNVSGLAGWNLNYVHALAKKKSVT